MFILNIDCINFHQHYNPTFTGSRIDDMRSDDDEGPPELENHNGSQQEAVFSDEECDSPPQPLKRNYTSLSDQFFHVH